MKLFGIAVLGLIGLLGLMGLWYQFMQPTISGIILFLIIGLVPLYLVYTLVTEEKKQKDFLLWVLTNGDQIATDTLRYKGFPVGPRTELRRFYFTISVGIVSMKCPTQYFVGQYESSGMRSLKYTVLSLLFGWWGFPWGIVYTIQSVKRNISGGDIITVAELIAQSKQLQPETK